MLAAVLSEGAASETFESLADTAIAVGAKVAADGVAIVETGADVAVDDAGAALLMLEGVDVFDIVADGLGLADEGAVLDAVSPDKVLVVPVNAFVVDSAVPVAIPTTDSMSDSFISRAVKMSYKVLGTSRQLHQMRSKRTSTSRCRRSPRSSP
ncbi:hypothetical protein PF001_g5879 [Phytophthora fragariae]|uniref:Uncharacterized protein n=1 Tax=Phytophthora fragariae TaxID=53985 RepID=A0A6A3LH27_9STRA|nr:hypothetical protein PF011_g6755 [Phytophthora fragariae]KAE9149723.1 hypothetical protein PF006_g5809 [Phytophthora fragariae]KAE9319467.1 hypothetical protein PF001_g5879 [Phytophthora fragariae]